MFFKNDNKGIPGISDDFLCNSNYMTSLMHGIQNPKFITATLNDTDCRININSTCKTTCKKTF